MTKQNDLTHTPNDHVRRPDAADSLLDDIFLLAMHNKGLISILDEIHGETIRLDGNSPDNLTKISALLEAILRNAKRLEKKCYKAVHFTIVKA